MTYFNSYFKRLPKSPEKKGEEEETFEAWQSFCHQTTMVLFSKTTCTPLAALLFEPKDKTAKSVLTARPAVSTSATCRTSANSLGTTVPHFQGMLDRDDQVFYFTIVNLSEDGGINFNIIHTPEYKVNCVDPGPSYGINEVNELRPGRTYTVRCDQRTHREMILKGKTEPNNSSLPVTVEAEEKSGGNSLTFYLSVVASVSCDGLLDKFKEGTYWKATPYFIRKKRQSIRTRGEIEPHYDNPLGEVLDGAMDPRETMEECDVRPPALKRRAIEQKCLVHNVEVDVDVDIGQTQAAELNYGSHVEVNSFSTGFEYAYDFPSEPTAVSLSIWPGLRLFHSFFDMESLIREELRAWEQDHTKKMIENLPGKFKSETCVIDLEEEPTMIICNCGHQCLCRDDAAQYLKSKSGIACPICRGPIHAIVDSEVLAEPTFP